VEEVKAPETKPQKPKKVEEVKAKVEEVKAPEPKPAPVAPPTKPQVTIKLNPNMSREQKLHASGKFTEELMQTVKDICKAGKGILAADESTGTIGKRFEGINVENTHENR